MDKGRKGVSSSLVSSCAALWRRIDWLDMRLCEGDDGGEVCPWIGSSSLSELSGAGASFGVSSSSSSSIRLDEKLSLSSSSPRASRGSRLDFLMLSQTVFFSTFM